MLPFQERDADSNPRILEVFRGPRHEKALRPVLRLISEGAGKYQRRGPVPSAVKIMGHQALDTKQFQVCVGRKVVSNWFYDLSTLSAPNTLLYTTHR